jgi:hypothetical protein
MRSFRHWRPSYVRDRLAESWFRQRNPDAPWLTRDATAILDSWLRRTDVGIEWGSGRSTRWIGKRIARLTSLEHNADWYARVRRDLPPSVELRLYPDTPQHDPACAYVRVTEEVPDLSLDLALVDGVTELRDACARSVIPKLKPGALLVVDNANWFIPHPSRSPGTAVQPASPLWRTLAETLADWRCIWTSNGVTDTALWVKPGRAVE